METVSKNIVEDQPFTPFLKKLTIFASGGPFLDGYIMTIIGVALLQIGPQLQLDTFWTSMVGAAALIGLLVGGGVFGYVTDLFGRKIMYVINPVLVIVLSIAQIYVNSGLELVILRFLIGVAVGADYPISTSILAEFSPRRLRAKMLGLVSCAFYAGATVAGIAGYFMLNLGSTGWKWMLASSAFPALILVLERWRTPESPRWLLKKGRQKKALEVIKFVYGPDAELKHLEEDSTGKPTRFWKLFEKGYFKRTIFVCLFWTLQIVPLYAIYTFGPQILNAFGLNEGDMSIIGYSFISLFFMVGCIPPLFWINSIGRRPVIIFGFVIMTVGMLILGLFHNAPTWVVLLGFGLYAFFSGAPNILSFIYPNELFPTEIRGSAVGFGTAFTRIGAAAGTFGLPYALNSIGIENTMLICAAMSFLGVLICVAWAPETKGLSLAEASSIQTNISNETKPKTG